MVEQPVSVTSVNGASSVEDNDDTAVDNTTGANGFPSRDGRSVSSTVHDRSRTTTSATSGGGKSSKHSSHRHSIATSQQPNNPETSPPSARETFLNYFFGQNGPGPMSGSSVEALHGHHQHVHVGRDMSGSSMQSGLIAGKRSLDGNNVAFDMKSLGKHIEAVSMDSLSSMFPLIVRTDTIGWGFQPYYARGNGNLLDTIFNCFVLLHRSAEHTRPHPQSHHAFPRQSHLATRTKPTGRITLQTRAFCGPTE